MNRKGGSTGGRRKTVHGGFLCCCVVACAVWVSADIPVASAGARPEAGFRVQYQADLPYVMAEGGPADEAQRCDLYLPQPAEDEPLAADHRWPVVIVIHGGGWATGDKWTMNQHARQLAKRGFAAVSINYRLAPESKFPDQVDDLRLALVWVHDNADRYRFDLQGVGLYGYSAGGHLASLVGMLADEPWDRVRATTRWEKNDPRFARIPKIAAVCAGGPPTDFRYLPPDNTLLAYFLGGSRRECPDIYDAASPICFTSPGDPPVRIIHGEADGVVSLDESRKFHQALVASNVEASLNTVPDAGHLLAFISPKLSEWMLTFFRDHLKN